MTCEGVLKIAGFEAGELEQDESLHSVGKSKQAKTLKCTFYNLLHVHLFSFFCSVSGPLLAHIVSFWHRL